jgi:hypothetical protein
LCCARHHVRRAALPSLHGPNLLRGRFSSVRCLNSTTEALYCAMPTRHQTPTRICSFNLEALPT